MRTLISRLTRPILVASALACSSSVFAADFSCAYAGGTELACTETQTLTQVRVPMYSEAYDLSRVQRLARAVLCAGTSDCRVRFADEPITLAGLDPLALVDQTDAALND